MFNIALLFLSGRQDSNLRPPGPKPGALPIAPRPENGFISTLQDFHLLYPATPPVTASPFLSSSGRQDSNLRPPGPKPGALPIAPRPEEIFAYQDSVFLNRRANLVLFFNKNNIFACKNKKSGYYLSNKYKNEPFSYFLSSLYP